MKNVKRNFSRNERPDRGEGSILLIFTITFVLTVFGGIWNEIFAQTDSVNLQAKLQIIDGDEWHYFKGQQDPPQEWYSYDFDMSAWHRGSTGIGYGIGSNRTYLADMKGNYSSIYARKEFTINDRRPAVSIKLSVSCDGPFVAYLNGVEIIRTNTVQARKPDVSSGVLHAEVYDISGFIHELIPDNNVLALKCDNDDLNSEDFSFIPVFQVFENGEGQ